MIKFNVGAVRKLIEGQDDETPILILDPDGLLFSVGSMTAYEGCNELPAISIQLEEDEEDEVDDEDEEEDEEDEEDDDEDEDDEESGEPIDSLEIVIPVHHKTLTDDH